MRTDHPATEHWLDQTATRCAEAFDLRPQQREALRALLVEAVDALPAAAIEADLMTSMHGVLARERRQRMCEEAWSLWQEALRIYRRAGGPALSAPGTARDEWQSLGLVWFKLVSGSSLRQPVRLVKRQGRPRDMVVSAVQIRCDQDETGGYAVLEAVVYRPPRTSSCQIFMPGDELQPLAWEDLPARARLDAELAL